MATRKKHITTPYEKARKKHREVTSRHVLVVEAQIKEDDKRKLFHTIVIGHNTFWKQNSNLGKVGNQNFVQIPFYKFVKQIEYRAENLGIRIIMQEESYTSKASFLDKDDIPVYGKTEGEPSFSGTRYQRGMYRSKDGTVLNADLNGSANILRKAVPDAFGEQAPLFNEVCVFPHPYFEEMLSNSAMQCANQAFASQKEKGPSRAKMRRLARKQLK